MTDCPSCFTGPAMPSLADCTGDRKGVAEMKEIMEDMIQMMEKREREEKER